MNTHKTLFNQIIEEERQGAGPVTVACACHAMEVFARHFETMRPGDVIAIVHPDKCMEHDSGNPDCSCNNDDHQDIARIE